MGLNYDDKPYIQSILDPNRVEYNTWSLIEKAMFRGNIRRLKTVK